MGGKEGNEKEGGRRRREGKGKEELGFESSMEGEVLILQARRAWEDVAGRMGIMLRMVGGVQEDCSRSWWKTRPGRVRYVVGFRCS